MKLIHGDVVVVELNPREFWSVREGFHEVCSIYLLCWSTCRISGSILLTSAYLFLGRELVGFRMVQSHKSGGI